MFFFLSKIFWILAQPLSLAFSAGFFGWIAALLRFRRIGLLLGGFSSVILFATLFTTAGSVVLQGLEGRFAAPAGDPDSLACMIVLGGAFENEVNTVRHGTELTQAGERFVEAARLALAFPESRILVSGGDGSISGAYEGDAVTAGRFFRGFGIDPSRLVLETTSRNTQENAENTRSLLTAAGLSDCLLITSAFHMPRSVGLFRKAYIAVRPWPVDYRTSGVLSLGLDLSQPTLNAQQTATAVREWIGLVAYFLTGRTSTLYPR